MLINKLESAIVMKFLECKGLELTNGRELAGTDIVSSREFTGLGFICEFVQSERLQVGRPDESYIWNKLGALLNSKHDSGYLVYVEDGTVVALEGFAYDDAWPQEEIVQVDVYVR